MPTRPESKMQIADDLAWQITADATAERLERIAEWRGFARWFVGVFIVALSLGLAVGAAVLFLAGGLLS